MLTANPQEYVTNDKIMANLAKTAKTAKWLKRLSKKDTVHERHPANIDGGGSSLVKEKGVKLGGLRGSRHPRKREESPEGEKRAGRQRGQCRLKLLELEEKLEATVRKTAKKATMASKKGTTTNSTKNQLLRSTLQDFGTEHH